jgi:glycine cleavage system regulatory protein
MATLVLTVIGDDRTGLVDAISDVVARHGASWDRSSMARLGDKFAGIVEISVPDARSTELIDALGPLESQGLLDITIERVETVADVESSRRLTLQLVGHDRPGIVHEVSHALAEHGVGIDELHTETTSAPMSAEVLFHARAVLRAPVGVSRSELSAALEGLANELMVDIELDVPDAN